MLEDFVRVNKLRATIVQFKKPAQSPRDISTQFGIPFNQVGLTTVFWAQDNPKDSGEAILVVGLASQTIDEKKVGALFPESRVRLALSDESLEATGYDSAFVPPLSVYGAITLLDERVLEQNEIVCFAGNAKQAIKISPKEIEQFGENVIVGDYCMG